MQRSGTTEVRVLGRPDAVARLHRLGRELRLTDQILTADVDRVAIVESGPAPAWTSLDGQTVTFSASHMPEPTSTFALGVWLGTNAHEIGHVLFSPRADSPLIERMLAAIDTHRPGLAKAHNILEDQRQERLLLGRFAAWRGYLLAALAHHISGDQPGAWVLLAGRTWLDANARAAARMNAVGEQGEPFAAAVERIVGAYQRLTDPGDADAVEAWALLCEFDDLLGAMPCQPPTFPTCPIIAEGQPDTDAEPSRVPAAADWDDDEDDEPEGAGEGDDDEGDDAAAVAPLLGAGDQNQGPSSKGDEAEADAAPARGAGTTGAKPGTMNAAMREAAEKALKDEAAAADLKRVADAIDTPGATGDSTAPSAFGENREATDHARALERQVSDALLDLKDAAEPGYLRRVDSGRLNVRRWLTDPTADYDQMFDRFDPGALDTTGLEVVLLLDVSGSMTGQTGKLAEATWAIRQAVDRMEGALTIFTFAHEHRVLSRPGDRADDRMFVPQAYGGTVPTSALFEAHRIVEGSPAANRLVLILTDGDWADGPGRQGDAKAAIAAIQDTGAVVGVAFLGSIREVDRGQKVSRRITNLDELALMFREIARHLIEEKLSA